MSKVLFIKGNPKAVELSTSLSLGEEFIKAYRVAKPEDEIAIRDY